MIYEDSELLVCQKPSGFPVQSRKIGEKDCVSELKTYLYEKNSGIGEPYLGVVHRIDQPVEGLLVFAKTKQAAAKLSGGFRGNNFMKEYEAVICGKMKTKSGILVDYLKKDERMNHSSVVDQETTGAKRAELEYHILKEQENYSLAAIHLVTGRHHQIRVQMANAGCPLYGDRKYGIKDQNVGMKDTIGLCAVKLSFIHPKTGKKMVFTCKPEGTCFAWFE